MLRYNMVFPFFLAYRKLKAELYRVTVTRRYFGRRPDGKKSVASHRLPSWNLMRSGRCSRNLQPEFLDLLNLRNWNDPLDHFCLSLESHFGNFIFPVQVFIPPLDVNAYLLPLQLGGSCWPMVRFLAAGILHNSQFDGPGQLRTRQIRRMSRNVASLQRNKVWNPSSPKTCRWFYMVLHNDTITILYVRYISFIFLQLMKVSACAIKILQRISPFGWDLTRKLDSGAWHLAMG